MSRPEPTPPFRVRPRVRHAKTLSGINVAAALASAARSEPPPASLPISGVPISEPPISEPLTSLPPVSLTRAVTAPAARALVASGSARSRAITEPAASAPEPSRLAEELQLPPELDVERLFADRYRLEDQLDAIGSTTIWSAYDTFVARDVLLEQSPRTAGSMRSAEEASVLTQAGVLAPRDVGCLLDTDFVVVERTVGESLARRIERDGRLPTAECARILDQVVEPLARMHDRGLVHGAIDARSLFLERPAMADDPPRVLLLARGVARILEAGTATCAAIGAPIRAPEQIREGIEETPASDVGPPSDAFALAAVLYLALTGRAPFVGRNAADTKQQILSRTFDPPSALRRELHPSVDAFFRRAFAVDPGRRFGSVRELAAVFCRVVDDPASSVAIPQLAPTQLTTLPPRPLRLRPAIRFAALAAVLAAGAVAGAAWLLDGSAEVGAAEPPRTALDAAR